MRGIPDESTIPRGRSSQLLSRHSSAHVSVFRSIAGAAAWKGFRVAAIFHDGDSKMNYAHIARDAYDPWFSLDSVHWHTGTPRRFVNYAVLAVRRAVVNGASAIAELGPHLLRLATDTRMLSEQWQYLARHGGRAPGPNGRTYSDLGSQPPWPLLRMMSADLRKGTYPISPPRRFSFPKDPNDASRGTRTIHLINIEDRITQRGIVEVLQPLLDPRFGDRVFGFRPRRSHIHALAAAERIAIDQGRWYWVTEDIQSAFDRVPLGPLREVLHHYIPSAELVELTLTLVGTQRRWGIQQGGPLSPLLLNLYLHHHLDIPWHRSYPNTPLLRYADDLLLLCRTKREASCRWNQLQKLLLPAGMLIKGNAATAVTHNLDGGDPAEWLGFEIRRQNDAAMIRIADGAWDRLDGHLSRTHLEPNSPLRARLMMMGWVSQIGPCYEHCDQREFLDQLRRQAQAQGFDELPSHSALKRRWKRAWEHWIELRKGQRVETCGAAAVQPTCASQAADPNEPPF